jgi:hypothetical protein
LGGAATEEAEEQPAAPAVEVQEAVESVATEAAPAVEEAQEAVEAVATEAAPAVTEVQEQVKEVQEEVQEAAEGEVEEAAVEIDSINAKLQEFNSYRSRIMMSFDGTDTNGQPVNGNIEILIEQIREPRAMHMSMTAEGSTMDDMGGVDSFEFYEVDGTMYMQNPEDGSWLSFPSMEEEDTFSQGFFSPDDMIDLPKTARRSTLPENINNISTWRYTFNEKDITEGDMTLEKASGTLWMARDGGYPVKLIFEGTSTASTNPVGEDLFAAGNFRMEYELLEVNTDFTITPPEEALSSESLDLGGMMGDVDVSEIEFPMMDDAEVEFAMEGLVNYYSNASIEAIVEFYRQQLPAQGWTPDTSFEFVSEDSALLTFKREGVDLTISLGLEGDGRVNVSLFTTEAQ